MTAPDLDALAALLDKATPGPWHKIDKPVSAWVQAGKGTAVAACRAKYRSSDHVTLARNNAALIVAAVNALPALIARVRELEQWQHDMVEKAAAKSLDGYRELAARAAAAENERDEARAAALAMRERCAEICSKAARERTSDPTSWATAADCAAAIRQCAEGLR